MRTRDLDYESAVLAYDPIRHCYRVVHGAKCNIVDEYGRIVKGYTEVDTDLGVARFPGIAAVRIVRGTYRIVLKELVAEALSNSGQ